MIPYLKKAGVKFIDYHDKPAEPGIKGDGHPSPKGHFNVASQLAKDINAFSRASASK
jgi:hypothetical protein